MAKCGAFSDENQKTFERTQLPRSGSTTCHASERGDHNSSEIFRKLNQNKKEESSVGLSCIALLCLVLTPCSFGMFVNSAGRHRPEGKNVVRSSPSSTTPGTHIHNTDRHTHTQSTFKQTVSSDVSSSVLDLNLKPMPYYLDYRIV